ncbi:MAG: cardiolipin synthase, partial [Candidatus Sulfobium sp.]
FFLSFCLFLLIAEGCASLPDVTPLIHDISLEGKTPSIMGAEGALPEGERRKVIDRLKRQVRSTDMLERHVAVMELFSASPLVKGNKATLLIDGESTYRAMFRAIANARDHINFETFIFNNDRIGRKLADLFLLKQSEGVEVNVIYDSAGSFGTPASFFDRLREGGVRVLEFNPINPLDVRKEWLITRRDHRKIMVVDGRIAITGGVNISQVYSSGLSGPERSGDKKEVWRDTDVQIEGPVVAEFQKLFLETWKRQKGPELPESEYFPVLKPQGSDLIRVVGSRPGDINRTTYIMYVSAFTYAAHTIHLTNAYFVPDEQTIKALTGAAKRGADVKIILPGSSDEALAFYAGRYYYSRLLEAGVKLYERQKAILHSKTAVIDGIWSTVGSTNMDFWSFASNNEVNAVILSRQFAVQMEHMFQRDLAESRQVTLAQWEKRPLFPRLREWFFHLFKRWL